MLSERLQEFLMTYCNPETEPEFVADVMHGRAWAYYKDWLPRELFTALQSRELNPATMGSVTGTGFDDQKEVEDWFRAVWPTWFSEPYPGPATRPS